MTINNDTIAKIEKALHHGGLYVDPSMQKQVPPAVQVKIKAAIAQQDVPIYVVVIQNSIEDPNYHGDSSNLLGTIHADLGGQGTYFASNTNYSDIRIDSTSFGTPDAFEAAYLAPKQHPGDLGAQLLWAVQNYQKPSLDAAYEKATTSYRATAEHPDHGGGFPSAVGWGGGIIAVLVIVAVVAKKRRRTTVPALSVARTTNRPFTLPASVLTTITQARDRDREESAGAEVLALGEAIGSATMNSSSADAWQAALDQYDLARRIMQRQHSPADTVGALVLTRRGRSALAAAQAGKAWTPEPSCYFNPLHDPGASTVTWKGERGMAAVPACASCAKAIKVGTEPEDVLDFADHHGRKHYFDLDLGIWSQTGYGSLDVDLVTRLFATG